MRFPQRFPLSFERRYAKRQQLVRLGQKELRLGILEHEITRVPHGRAIIVPYSDRTHGHASHTYAVLYKAYLEELLKSPQR